MKYRPRRQTRAVIDNSPFGKARRYVAMTSQPG